MSTWVKVYNSMPSNPKLLKAGERAGWLYVCGLCYANEHLTNGFIPRYALAVVAPGVKGAMTLAKHLVSATLWHEVEGGWRIHDYNHHQRSAEEIRDRRAADSARKAASRSTRSPHGQIADSAKNPSGVRDSPRARDRGRSQDVDVDVEKEEAKASSRRVERAEEKCSDDDTKLCRLLAELATARNPKFKVKSRSRWLTDMRLLRDRDENAPGEIEAVIRWTFTDTSRDAQFWADVIRSPSNLRMHFPQIWSKMQTGPQLRSVSVEDSEAFLARRGVVA